MRASAACVLLWCAWISAAGSEWNEQTLYVTRIGPAEPAVQQAEPAVQQPAPAAVVTDQPPARAESGTGGGKAKESAFEPGMIPVVRTARGREDGAAADAAARRSAAPAQEAMAPARIAPATSRSKSGAAPGKKDFIDKFIDKNDDGYNDKTRAQDL